MAPKKDTESRLGIERPDGMDLECLKKLASLFNQRTDPDCETSNYEFAVEAFKIARRSPS